jgi:hypothetical protein
VATSDLFLFVSHVAENRNAAMEIVDELERRGTRCWIAPRDVRPGEAFDNEIADAIEASRAMLLIFSDLCNDSEYIRREVTVAGESHKTVIPFRIEDVQPRRGLRVRLSDLHWIDGFTSRERAIDEVIKKFAPSTNRPVAPPLNDEDQQNTPKIQAGPKAADTIDQSPPIMPVTPDVPAKEPIRPLPLSHKEETPEVTKTADSRTTAPAPSNITFLQVVCALLVLQGIVRALSGIVVLSAYPWGIPLPLIFLWCCGPIVVISFFGIASLKRWARVLGWIVVGFGLIVDGMLVVVSQFDPRCTHCAKSIRIDLGAVAFFLSVIIDVVVIIYLLRGNRSVPRAA